MSFTTIQLTRIQQVGERKHPWFQLHCYLNYWRRKTFINGVLFFLRGSFGIVAFLTVAGTVLLQFVDPQQQGAPPWLVTWLEYWDKNQFIICSKLLLMQTIAGLAIWVLAWLAKRDPIDERKVKVVLNSLVDEYFEDRKPEYVYRATLFEERGFWGVGHWLGIVERSGEVFPNRRTIFSVDPQHPTRNTGIVGECWFRAKSGKGAAFSRIVEISDPQATSSEAEQYIEESWMDEREFDRATVLATYFHVTEIRRHGRIWGVLVLDCNDPQFIEEVSPQAEKKRKKQVLNTASFINLLIES